MKIYKLVWRTEDDVTRKRIIASEDIATRRYRELCRVLTRGCYACVVELSENKDGELIEGEILHYKEL